MDDERVWNFERDLWLGGEEHYRKYVEDDCVMVVPAEPYVMSGTDAIKAVADAPRWSEVEFSEGVISRPEHGMIVLAYKADARRDGGHNFVARCSSTYRRLEEEEWRVVQHHQSVADAP